MRIVLLITITVLLVVSATWSADLTQQTKKGDLAAITKLENDQVKADLAGDISYYETNLAEDFVHGTGRGTWYTKQSLLKDLRDHPNNHISKSQISNLRIHLYGSTAIAAYDQSYEATVSGQYQQQKVINTDVFVKNKTRWMMVASHTSRVLGP